MLDLPSFPALIRRVRAGDADAAAELVRTYEPEIRRAVRIRLTDPRLRRTLDSMDICQSVMANFFVRAAAGQFDIEDPGQLLKLLVKMAKNKVLDWARHEQADRRDGRRLQAASPEDLHAVAGAVDTPSQIVSGREMLEAMRARMNEEERELADQRIAGLEWVQIAAARGGTPEALRKRYERAIDRITKDLGLDEENHE
jgi:RNA polymerase sigma-70 factor (ECF subfamily)